MSGQGRVVGNGHVTLYPPTAAKPYYRLDYVDETGRRRQPSAGRSPAAALAKAGTIDAQLSRFRGGDDARTLGDLVDEYLSTPVGRWRTARGQATTKDWQPSQFASVKKDLNRAITEVRELPAWQLDRSVIDHMRTACGTAGGVKQMTGRVRCFLRWCEEQGALTPSGSPCCPRHWPRPARPRFAQPETRPRRPHMAPLQGRSEQYIDEEDCPSRHDVLQLAAAMARAMPAWGKLAVHTAVGLGLREGEQFQLRADDLRHLEGKKYLVHVDWQWSGGRSRRALPKHGRRRVVPVYTHTRDGYPLLDALLARADQARSEQAAGRNPEALLFPAQKGGMLWPSGFSTDLVVPAMKAAGWKYDMIHEVRTVRGGERKMVTVTQMHRTWHSLRHRFARDVIDGYDMGVGALTAVGGWKDFGVVRARYYQTGREHLDDAWATLSRGPVHT